MPVPECMDAETARRRFSELVDDSFQWWLRLPPVNLLWRRDFVRFVVSLQFLVDQLLDGVYALNLADTASFARERPDSVASLPSKPERLIERVEDLCSLRDLYVSEREARALIRETISLGCGRFGLDFPWLSKVVQPDRPDGFRLHPQQRRHEALARELVASYRKLGETVAVGVSDSVGKGLADETSDLDLDVICHCVPQESARRRTAERHSDDPKEVRIRDVQSGSTDEFFAGSILVDTRYLALSRWSALLAEPEPKDYWDEEALAHADSMRPLWDPDGVITAHKRILAESTERRRPGRVSRVLAGARAAVVRLEASTPMGKYGFFTATADALQAMYQVLAGLNDRWTVFPKWARQWAESLAAVPDGFTGRVEAMLLESFPKDARAEVAAAAGSIARDLAALAEGP